MEVYVHAFVSQPWEDVYTIAFDILFSLFPPCFIVLHASCWQISQQGIWKNKHVDLPFHNRYLVLGKPSQLINLAALGEDTLQAATAFHAPFSHQVRLHDSYAFFWVCCVFAGSVGLCWSKGSINEMKFLCICNRCKILTNSKQIHTGENARNWGLGGDDNVLVESCRKYTWFVFSHGHCCARNRCWSNVSCCGTHRWCCHKRCSEESLQVRFPSIMLLISAVAHLLFVLMMVLMLLLLSLSLSLLLLLLWLLSWCWPRWWWTCSFLYYI